MFEAFSKGFLLIGVSELGDKTFFIAAAGFWWGRSPP
jgi:putative Ca2+/H+ antiporter (TMEM165/GDT1 family)